MNNTRITNTVTIQLCFININDIIIFFILVSYVLLILWILFCNMLLFFIYIHVWNIRFGAFIARQSSGKKIKIVLISNLNYCLSFYTEGFKLKVLFGREVMTGTTGDNCVRARFFSMEWRRVIREWRNCSHFILYSIIRGSWKSHASQKNDRPMNLPCVPSSPTYY